MKSYPSVLIFACLILCCAPRFGLHAQGARVFFYPTTVSYGAVEAGKTALGSFVITDFDTLSLHGHIGMPADSVFTLVSSDTFSLAAHQSDTVWVRFAPTAVGAVRDSLWITHDGKTSAFTTNPQKILLTGSGLSPNDTTARITFIPAPFGSLRVTLSVAVDTTLPIDTTVSRGLVFWNTTDTARHLYGKVIGVHLPFSLPTGSEVFDLADSTYDTLVFTFAATSVGTFLDTVLLISNANSPNDTNKIILSASVTPKAPPLPQLILSTRTIQFGTVAIGTSPVQTVIITNLSKTMPVTFNLLQNPNPPYGMTMTNSSGTVEAGTTDTITVSYTPKVAQQDLDTIRLSTNAAAPNARITIPISGTGVAQTGGVAEIDPALGMKLESKWNTATGTIDIALILSEARMVTLSLFDAAGHHMADVYSGMIIPGEHIFRVPTASLADGVYLAQIQCEGGTTVAKVIIRH